jgi:lipopolysaccharide transport system permease protein
MAVLGFGIGIILSSLTTKYRDLSYLLTFGVQLLMYATPVIYSLNSTGGKLKQIILLNPTTSIIENFRYSVFWARRVFVRRHDIFSGFFLL